MGDEESAFLYTSLSTKSGLCIAKFTFRQETLIDVTLVSFKDVLMLAEKTRIHPEQVAECTREGGHVGFRLGNQLDNQDISC